MPSLSERDRLALQAIADSIRKIEKFTSEIATSDEFYEDEKTFDSVLMNFVIIGESVDRLSNDFKSTFTQIPWIQVKSFRNLVAHNYFGIDSDEVWQLIKNHLPVLKIFTINLLD
jgi:uncharacterized protein with HEPN domain